MTDEEGIGEHGFVVRDGGPWNDGPVRVKLCGTARVEDLRLAQALDVDYVGFIFAESPRRVLPEDVAAWRREVAAPIPAAVGVFMDAPLAEIERAARTASLDYIQLHGDESPDFCKEASKIAPVIKAVCVDTFQSLAVIDVYRACHAVLIEPFRPGRRGGTVVPLDLTLASHASRRFPIFLAGGLRPDTVAEAVRAVRPFAVDVASGVESEPGRKDPDRARRFVEAARTAYER